jgi:predicted PurR-regulated permease PerM
MLGRGVDLPMPMMLFGALGGMATAGILGMFGGATALALGYEIFMKWVAMVSESATAQTGAENLKAPSAAAS